MRPLHMIDAVNTLASEGRTIVECTKSSEVFFVHLSEAARLYEIESMICKSLLPRKDDSYAIRPFQDEEVSFLPNKNNCDVHTRVKGNGPINFDLRVKT
ncbi:hypothetical protein L195_g056044 [Trifolium pratense]|uniref:Uncharacterized protein n=1 Tax=Trifolium pratense TaxID=57577 RepID=A0A2K3KPM4_TRIPR|nr:hypothetical protein L195_g056044 [Trifolium pratense]